MFGEPLAPTAERIAEFRARAAAFGRTPTFNMSFRPILADTEGAAWDRARRILASVQKPGDPTGFGNNKKPLDQSARRLLDFAAAGETHDERLWMPIAGRPAPWATPPAWSARPSRSRAPCSNTTSSASTPS